jgi:hypothetical protein
MKLPIIQYSVSLFTVSLFSLNILLNAVFLNNPSCSSLNVKDYASHPYKTTGKIMCVYTEGGELQEPESGFWYG